MLRAFHILCGIALGLILTLGVAKAPLLWALGVALHKALF